MPGDVGPASSAPYVGRLQPVTSHRQLATLLLALPGALLAHSLAYLWAHPGSITLNVGRSHGYLPVAGPLLGLGGALVLAWLVTAGVRAAGPDLRPGVVRLAVVQALAFCAQESIEALVGGAGFAELWVEPAVLLGLALQWPVAALLVGLVRAGETLVGFLHASSRRTEDASHDPRIPVPFSVPARPVVLSVGRRGPPVVV
jgi:hypothetical protein